ncbi:MAG: hypothetical protein Q3993_05565 [Filifactor alocis]|nr:hypothetical protein [Filifactor alocis]
MKGRLFSACVRCGRRTISLLRYSPESRIGHPVFADVAKDEEAVFQIQHL